MVDTDKRKTRFVLWTAPQNHVNDFHGAKRFRVWAAEPRLRCRVPADRAVEAKSLKKRNAARQGANESRTYKNS